MLLKSFAEDDMVHCCSFPHSCDRVFRKSSAAGSRCISVAELMKTRQVICGLGKLLTAEHLEGSAASNASKSLSALPCSVAPATEESEDISAVVRDVNR